MNKSKTVVVVGLGEVGKPLHELISEHHNVVGVDISPPPAGLQNVDVMHICFPFQIKDFVGECARYIEMFSPKLTVINSTVAVGTTRAVAQRAGTTVAYSPVRGKHARMLEDMRRYTKFVGGLDRSSAEQAANHFESVGLKTKILSSPEATELAKLTETTFFGLMIAWAQEVERYADQIGQNYEEIVAFYEEIGFFPPVKYFPGVIGGHCVMPNIELFKRFTDSEILKSIESSNQKKIDREAKDQIAVDRNTPK
jgi:UDP-N-acetyl-D-mannosaminuronate dehydrogenase